MMTENDHDYFERMLEAQFKALEDKIDRVIKLQEIANGRTSKNEESINDLKNWRASSQGVWKAASIIGSAIGAIVGFLIALWLR